MLADATYKILWRGFPILIIGTTDKDKVFHPYGIAITEGESSEDYAFVFECLKSADFNLIKPTYLIADSAEQITVAFREIFGSDFIRVNCWAHKIRNIDNKLSLIPDEIIRKKIRTDILFLQLAASQREFDKASKLLLIKWSKEDSCKTFLDYFKEECLGQRNGWFEGKCILKEH